METIAFRDVSFTYPQEKKAALNHITFSVTQSEFVVVCGTSGSGKTTLLRHMKKNLMPFGSGSGEILYAGSEIEKQSDRISAEEIGYVMQNPDNQIVTDTVWKELAFGMESIGLPKRMIRRRTAEMAEYFGIGDWFRKNVWELSGGQKQLMNLAAVMTMQPKLLVLDEPTAQLDPIAAGHFLETLRKINLDFGTTIILSEHRLEESFPLADRVLVMQNGQLVADGKPEAFGDIFMHQGDINIYEYLPASMHIYSGIQKSLVDQKNDVLLKKCPVTVRDARIWLEDLVSIMKNTDRPNMVPNNYGDIAEKDTTLKNHQNDMVNAESAVGYKGTKKNKTSFFGRRSEDEHEVLSARNLHYRYGRQEQDILNDVSMSLEEGRIYALMGGNGAGKSTLLKILCGNLRPYAGKVVTKKRISALPQNPLAVFTELSVEEELAEVFTGITGKGLSQDVIINRVEDMLNFMELEECRKRNPYDLSGGQQQKLAIGKVLLTEPDIILLDEPTKGIDPAFKKLLGRLMKKLTQQKKTILMVSHDIDFCAEYADECALLFDHTIITQAPVREFFCENNFYTTAANRISRNVLPGCVTAEQVVEAFKREVCNE